MKKQKKWVVLVLCLVLCIGCAGLMPATPVEVAASSAQSSLNYYNATKEDALASFKAGSMSLAEYNTIRAALCVFKDRQGRALDEYAVDQNAEDLRAALDAAESDLKAAVAGVNHEN